MTTSSDFFADLERQLVEATRDRPRRLRRARLRAAAGPAAAVALLAAGGAFVVTTAHRTEPRDAPSAPAVQHRGEPLPSRAALARISVAVFGDAGALAAGGGATAALAHEGIHVTSVQPSVAQRATRVYFAPGHARDATGVAIVLHAHGVTKLYAPVAPMTPAMRAESGGAGVLLIAGGATEPVAVLNATTRPGLARGVANRLLARGLAIGPVTNAARTAAATEVQYDPGHRPAALQVARTLHLGAGRVVPMRVRTKLVAGRGAPVAVVVGADRALTIDAAP